MFNIRGWVVTACVAFLLNPKITAAFSCPLFPTFFFNQTLDHNLSSPSPSAGNGTFQQQYELNTTYFRSGGPILFLQEGEGALNSTCVETTVFWDWAEEMGAIVASLEHRYFGLSVPDGFNASTATPSQYAYLTMNNTLLDAVNFVEWIKKTVQGAENSKVIVMGASYAGTLATLLRVHYPESFYGSLPAAPLLSAFGTDASNPNKDNWWEWLSNVYTEISFEAATKINASTHYFKTTLSSASNSTTGSLTNLINEMDLCEPYPQTSAEWSIIYLWLLTTYQFGAQYNYASAAAGASLFNISRPLQEIINQTLAANTTGAVLRIPLQLFSLEAPEHCLVWNSSRFNVNSIGLELTQWDRVECLFVPGSTSGILPGNVFPSQSGYLNYTEFCLSMDLSPSFAMMTHEEIIKYYRLTRDDLMNTKRILFTNGGYDPTTAVGPPSFPLSQDPDATRAVLMYGNAHHEEVFSNAIEDTEPVRLMHRIMKNAVKAWGTLDQEYGMV